MLIAVSAMHGRHALSRIWRIHTRSLGFDHIVVAVTDNDFENLACCNDFPGDMTGFFIDNQPLAGKFNAAMRVALDMGATRIMILPSDDFASPAWVKAAREGEQDYMIPHTCGVYDLPTGQAYRIVKLSFGTLKFGAGRVISRRAIDRIGGELWPQSLNRGLDSASHHRLVNGGIKPAVVETEGIPITDVKTKDNLWGFNTWLSGSRPLSQDDALGMLSPEVRAELLSIPT